MKFCRYYSSFLKGYGVPNLSLEQHQKLFSIISLENRYAILEEISISNENTVLFRDIEIRKYRIRNKLQSLVGKKYPKDLLKEFIHQSKTDHS